MMQNADSLCSHSHRIVEGRQTSESASSSSGSFIGLRRNYMVLYYFRVIAGLLG